MQTLRPKKPHHTSRFRIAVVVQERLSGARDFFSQCERFVSLNLLHLPIERQQSRFDEPLKQCFLIFEVGVDGSTLLPLYRQATPANRAISSTRVASKPRLEKHSSAASRMASRCCADTFLGICTSCSERLCRLCSQAARTVSEPDNKGKTKQTSAKH